jgi:hypothetical protein
MPLRYMNWPRKVWPFLAKRANRCGAGGNADEIHQLPHCGWDVGFYSRKIQLKNIGLLQRAPDVGLLEPLIEAGPDGFLK